MARLPAIDADADCLDHGDRHTALDAAVPWSRAATIPPTWSPGVATGGHHDDEGIATLSWAGTSDTGVRQVDPRPDALHRVHLAAQREPTAGSIEGVGGVEVKAERRGRQLATVTESVTVFPGTRLGENTTRGQYPGSVVGYTDQLPLLAAWAGRDQKTPMPMASRSDASVATSAPSGHQGLRRTFTQR